MRALRSRTIGTSSRDSDASINNNLTKVTKKKTRSRRNKPSVNNDTTETSDNGNDTMHVSTKIVRKISDVHNFIILANQGGSTNLNNENMPGELFELQTSSSSSEANKTQTYNEDCIVIDDSVDNSQEARNASLDKSIKGFKKNVASITFEKIDTSLSEKCSGEPSRRDTYEIKNSSGQWSVENVSDELLNDSVDRVILHKKPKSQLNLLNETYETPKSPRKKWIKFVASESQAESPILRNLTDETKISKFLCASTPFNKICPLTPARLNKSLRSNKKNRTSEINSVINSNKKSSVKPIPNFALIHQKTNDKMESIKDYSERKRERARNLFGNKQTGAKVSNTPKEEIKLSIQSNKENETLKSALQRKKFVSKLPSFTAKLQNNTTKQILPNIDSTSKTGFGLNKSNKPIQNHNQVKTDIHLSKLKNIKPIDSRGRIVLNKSTNKISEPLKKVEKPVSIFSKGAALAVANKTRNLEKLGNRDNRRYDLKGVRTNRRFDLLMQMRKDK